jgi:hypothetical protein
VNLPTLIVEAGFSSAAQSGSYLFLDDPARGKLDTATLAPDSLFTDITAYATTTVTTRRGANRVESPILRYEAGTVTVVLDNRDRRFDPSNLSGPYVSAGVTQVQPMRPVRIRATWNGVTYELFSGYADRWEVGYDKAWPSYSTCTLTATDATKVLSNYVRGAVGAVGAGEDSGARATRILNSVSWSATARMIRTGDTTVQATTLAGDAWTELLLTQDTEIGECYLDAGGRVVFRNRQATLEDSRSALPNATFGDQPVAGVSTTINLAKNPSVETNLTGWIAGGFANQPTISSSSAQALFGTKSMLVSWANASGGDLPQVSTFPTIDMMDPLLAGKTYTVSVYVYVPTGSPGIAFFSAQTGFTTNALVKDQWVRLTGTGTAGTTAGWQIQLWPIGGVTTVGQTFYVDGLQIEVGSTATAYVDGDQAGGTWDATAHASSSRRLPELPYSAIGTDYDDTTLANLVRATAVGGAQQVVQDAASQAAYLIKTYERSDLIMVTDADALSWAQFILYEAAQPELRFSSLELLPRGDSTNLFPQALGREFGDRIRIVRRPPGGGTITRDVFIRGVTHDISPDNWVTTWTLQSATRSSFLILDNPTLGRLDFNGLGY